MNNKKGGNSMTSQEIKEIAKRLGADEVAIGSIDRWEGAPSQQDPRLIMPKAKSIIAMSFRVFRGSLRGIEEGTYFSNYSAMGYGGITYLYMPMTIINMCKVIEDEGYEAVPYGHQSDWRAIDNKGYVIPNRARPVAPGKPVPDIMVNLRIAAFLCGLGEIGYSKMFLSPKFGPRCRVGIIITEMELEPDPIYNGPKLCNKCKACVRECPGNAISGEKTVKVTLAGHEVEWGELDCDACDIAFRGGELCKEGEKGTYQEGRDDVKPASHSPFYYKPANLYNTGQAVCGAKGCTRACMISMEKRGILSNKFHKPFRRKPLWSVDWSDYEAIEGGNTAVSGLGAMAKVKAAPQDVQNELSRKHEKEAD
jgi:ferredoxin